MTNTTDTTTAAVDMHRKHLLDEASRQRQAKLHRQNRRHESARGAPTRLPQHRWGAVLSPRIDLRFLHHE